MFGYWRSGCGTPGKIFLKGGYVVDRSAFTLGSIAANQNYPIVLMDESGVHTPPSPNAGVYFTYRPLDESSFIICLITNFNIIEYGSYSDFYFNGNAIYNGPPPKAFKGVYDMVAGYYCKKTNPILINQYEPDEAQKAAITSCVAGISATKATRSIVRAAPVAAAANTMWKLNTRYASITQPSSSPVQARAVLQNGAWGGYFYFKDWVEEQGGEFSSIQQGPSVYCEWQPNTIQSVRFRYEMGPTIPAVTLNGEKYVNTAYPVFGEYDLGKDGPQGPQYYNTRCKVNIEGTVYTLSIPGPSAKAEFYPGGIAAPGCHFSSDNKYYGIWARMIFDDP